MDLSIRVAVETILDQLKPNIAGEDPKNVIVSPASLDILLRTVACGAKGKTLDQLLSFLGAEDIDELNSRASSTMEVLRLASPENKPPVIEDVPEKYRYRYETEDFVPANVSCANAIWIDEQHSVKNSFKKLLSDKSTNGCINNFLNPEEINEDTPLVLTNAIYFKALWDDRFLKCSDYDIDDFYLIDGTNTVEVPFMSKWNRMLECSVMGLWPSLLLFISGHHL
ncbi:At1g47710 [Linum perenne]